MCCVICHWLTLRYNESMSNSNSADVVLDSVI